MTEDKKLELENQIAEINNRTSIYSDNYETNFTRRLTLKLRAKRINKILLGKHRRQHNSKNRK